MHKNGVRLLAVLLMIGFADAAENDLTEKLLSYQEQSDVMLDIRGDQDGSLLPVSGVGWAGESLKDLCANFPFVLPQNVYVLYSHLADCYGRDFPGYRKEVQIFKMCLRRNLWVHSNTLPWPDQQGYPLIKRVALDMVDKPRQAPILIGMLEMVAQAEQTTFRNEVASQERRLSAAQTLIEGHLISGLQVLLEEGLMSTASLKKQYGPVLIDQLLRICRESPDDNEALCKQRYMMAQLLTNSGVVISYAQQSAAIISCSKSGCGCEHIRTWKQPVDVGWPRSGALSCLMQ